MDDRHLYPTNQPYYYLQAHLFEEQYLKELQTLGKYYSDQKDHSRPYQLQTNLHHSEDKILKHHETNPLYHKRQIKPVEKQ